MTDQSEPLFLFGAGYSARHLSDLWTGPVLATARDSSRADTLEKIGIKPVPTMDNVALETALDRAHLVISAPPNAEGCPAFRLIGAMSNSLASVTYLSTTGVYGDRAGGWVMEWSELSPQAERARRRVLAEQAWAGVSSLVRLVRLPGIYGPSRSALDRVRAGTARRIDKPGHVFSRIHVDDLADGLKALILADQTGVFHLCDDHPAPPQDVTAFAQQLLDQPLSPLIPFDQADLSPMGTSFYNECKRVSNARIKAATGWKPQYPTYREGLRAVLETET